MRVAFVVDRFPALSETFVLAQIVGLIERGHDVQVLAVKPSDSSARTHADFVRLRMNERTHYRELPPKEFVPRLASAGKRLFHRVRPNPLETIEALNVFRHGRRALSLQLLHDTFPSTTFPCDFDVVHCHFGPNGQRAIAQRKHGTLRGPIVTTFHGYDANLLPRVEGHDMYAELFAQGQRFTVGSEFMRNRIVSLGARPETIVKLPMGVNTTRFSNREHPQQTNQPFTFLTIARLVEVKGIEYALDAFALVHRVYPHSEYQIAGDGPLRGALEQRAQTLGINNAVKFLGAVTQEDTPDLYNAAHTFVLPSVVTQSGEEENQPVVISEAQASGLPVIASNIGGVAESFVPGQSGLLSNQRDPKSIASAMIQIIDNPALRESMGRVGRKYVEELYDLHRLNDQLVTVYEQTIAEYRRDDRSRSAR